MKHCRRLIMLPCFLLYLITVVLSSLVASAASATVPAPAAQLPPNFIVILGEGAGWASTSVQMDDRNPASKSTTVSTPNLEKLAAAGLRFSDGYAASPRCTPSRAGLLTGRSPAALHMTFVGDGKRGEKNPTTKLIPATAVLELPAAEITLAEQLRDAGYATAHFGKWHLGRVDPARHGFDESDGPTGNGGPDNVASPNPKQALGMTARGIDFITRQSAAKKPFYLQLSHYPDQPEKGGAEKHLHTDDETRLVDHTIGQLLAAVDQLGLRANTYIVYTTDHGTPGKNPPLTQGKGSVWEGGIRVPFIIAGPGLVAGACSHVRVSALDLFPTFAELARSPQKLPPALEGGSLVPLFRDPAHGSVTRPREEFVIHYPHYDKDPIGPASALLLGQFKLIRSYETRRDRLYDLSADPAERRDLVSAQPEKSAELARRLDAYLAAVAAELPQPNPNADPNASDSRETEKRDRKSNNKTKGGGAGGKSSK